MGSSHPLLQRGLRQHTWSVDHGGDSVLEKTPSKTNGIIASATAGGRCVLFCVLRPLDLLMTGIFTLGILGLSLSVDAFAAAVGKGANVKHARWNDALRIGAVFGFFEAITPVVGWMLGLALSTWIAAVDHWIAFALLCGIGGNMIRLAMKDEPEAEVEQPKAVGRGALGLIGTALATSIDATAVGVSLGVMQVNILSACLVIGAVTTVMATAGVMLGRHASVWIGRYAEICGGIALMLIGCSILYTHLTSAAG